MITQRSKEKAVAVLWHVGVIIFCAILLYKWEVYFNYPTTHEPATLLWGDNPITLTFAQAVVGVDIIFLAHTILRSFVWKDGNQSFLDSFLNDKVATGMSSAWGVATTVDLFFTWFWFQGQQQIVGTSARIPQGIFNWSLFGWSAYDIIPIAGSGISWVAQAAIILAIARAIEKLGEIINGKQFYNNNAQPFKKYQPNQQPYQVRPHERQPQQQKYQPQHRPGNVNQQQSKPKPVPRADAVSVGRPEPSYHPVGWERVDVSQTELDFSEDGEI